MGRIALSLTLIKNSTLNESLRKAEFHFRDSEVISVGEAQDMQRVKSKSSESEL